MENIITLKHKSKASKKIQSELVFINATSIGATHSPRRQDELGWDKERKILTNVVSCFSHLP